jgi:hypothetical protein
VSTPWFRRDWPGWQQQGALDPSLVNHQPTPDDWRWQIRGRVPCPLCGAPPAALCVRDNGNATILIHSLRARLIAVQDGDQ